MNQTYRKFSTRSTSFIPILGFSRRPKMQGKLNKHWLSGKGLNAPQRAGDAAAAAATSAATAAAGGSNAALQSTRHLPSKPSSGSGNSTQTQTTLGGQLHERPFQRHLAMNLENDMYYTVDFSENSQHSPLIQWDVLAQAAIARAATGTTTGTGTGAGTRNVTGTGGGADGGGWLVKFTCEHVGSRDEWIILT